MELIHQLTPSLRRLRLSGVMETLELRNTQAVDDKISYLDFLALLLQDEVERRNMRQFDRRLKKAGFSSNMTVEGFDFGFNPTINKKKILDLATTRFIERKENVCFIGPAGVGKTHLASAIAHQACRRGFDVLFVKTSNLIRHLNQGRADGTWETRLKHYLDPSLLILDDWGLKAFGRPAADDIYEIVCERYERGSIMITSNRTVEEWPELFGDGLLASAALDRMVHHAHIITITGKSFRAKGLKKDP
ncbi:MAG: IS21-like element helper ATPase IstB, partial [Deltaproteobacteria bacterium]|nr:IS21-like element helper ATPase IstB [Deltaproteobacteria bacterium]